MPEGSKCSNSDANIPSCSSMTCPDSLEGCLFICIFAPIAMTILLGPLLI